MNLDVKTEAEARAGLYELLSTVFVEEPSPAFLEVLSSSEIASVISELGLRLEIDDPAAQAELLAHEYAYLFLGPGKHLPPFESVQRGAIDASGSRTLGQMHGEPAVQVSNEYARHGLEVAGVIKDQPDHLAAELAFMAHLCRLEAESECPRGRESLVAEQARFLKEHIGAWAPGYCRQVTDAASSSYYRGFAGLAADFIESEVAQSA